MYVWAMFLYLAVISGHVIAEDERDLKGKVAVVTGGAKGIGRAIVENFLKAGVKNLTFVDKNKPRGLETEKILRSKHGNRVWFIHGDVTKDLDRVWTMIYEELGCVNILVNNAGILDEYDPVTTIKTNLLAPMLWTERFMSCMRKDKGGKGGTIINTASTSGFTRQPFFWNYGASKYGVLGLTYGWGHEYNFMFSGVRMFAICPHFTYTDMTKQQMVVDEQVEIYRKVKKVSVWQRPDAVGQAAVVLYNTATTGTAYMVMGGEVSVAPDSMTYTTEYLLSL